MLKVWFGFDYPSLIHNETTLVEKRQSPQPAGLP